MSQFRRITIKCLLFHQLKVSLQVEYQLAKDRVSLFLTKGFVTVIAETRT